MTDPLPERLRRRAARPLVVPPPPLPAGNRAPIGWATLRAGFDAHKGSAHDGRLGLGCDTCIAYSAAVTRARTLEAIR